MAHVDFTHFDLRNLLARCNILNFGKKNSGKTTLTMNQLSAIHHFYPLGCAIAPTASVRLELSKHMPSSLIWPEFDLAKLTTVVSKFLESSMPDWMENINNRRADQAAPEADLLNWLLIMDDIGYDEKRFQHVTFKNMYMNGRQLGLGTILNLQKLKSIPPGLRGQLDYVFLFRDLSYKGQENIHREFFSFLPFPTFRELYLKCTEGFTCIVLDIAKAQRMRDLGNNPKSLTECIFVCAPKPIDKAPPEQLLPPFQMFHSYVWKLDIALKRLFKKRALENQLKQTKPVVPAPSNLAFQPRVASKPPLPTIPETKEQSPSTRTLSLPAQTRYSGYPISTFSSLKTIPTVKILRPSLRQRDKENGAVKKHADAMHSMQTQNAVHQAV